MQLDPYVAQAQNDDVSLLQKIEGMVPPSVGVCDLICFVDLNKIIQGAQTGMLTTRASDGHLHARAMTPASSDSGVQYERVSELPTHNP
jgi:hypothetical protein